MAKQASQGWIALRAHIDAMPLSAKVRAIAREELASVVCQRVEIVQNGAERMVSFPTFGLLALPDQGRQTRSLRNRKLGSGPRFRK